MLSFIGDMLVNPVGRASCKESKVTGPQGGCVSSSRQQHYLCEESSLVGNRGQSDAVLWGVRCCCQRSRWCGAAPNIRTFQSSAMLCIRLAVIDVICVLEGSFQR